MPELPEVQTTVNGIQKHVVGKKITDFWSDLPKKKVSRPDFEKTIKSDKYFRYFSQKIKGQKIVSAKRRAKNILIGLASGDTIHIHMKMTGHIMYGKYDYTRKTNTWLPHEKEKNHALRDPYNRFVHAVFSLSDGKHMIMSDSRKFGKITLIEKDKNTEEELGHLGREPLDEDFTFADFKKSISKKKSWPIKQTLLDQSVLAGIGNIYSDEMLWSSCIHPRSVTGKIPDKELRSLFKNMKVVLKKGLDFGGDSMSDYRNIQGERGSFQHKHNVYRKTGEKCKNKNCFGVIMREVIKGRSSHFCNKHQKIFK